MFDLICWVAIFTFNIGAESSRTHCEWLRIQRIVFIHTGNELLFEERVFVIVDGDSYL
jgi:hypothetical protein